MRDIALIAARRLTLAVPVVLGITVYVFLILQLSPANPRGARDLRQP
jgi:ABC-type dipeptide/oligopeptide/nickel transport system permease component